MDDPSGVGYEIVTQDNTTTYLVYTAAGLKAWMEEAQSDTDLSCTLYNCIDMQGESWTPVGDDNNRYTGTFDGDGHTVYNITIGNSSNYAGFFGYIGEDGKVTGLGLEGGSVTASTTYSNITFAGGIAGVNGGTITACYSTGNVTASTYAGGIAGYNASNGTITACFWSGNAENGVGGGSGSTENVAKVGSDDCKTWKNAEDAMNTALEELQGDDATEWRYTTTGATDDAPLKLTQSS